MKKIDIKKYLLFFCSLSLIFMLSCSQEEEVPEMGIEIAGASYDDVSFTRISSDEVRADVYLRLGVTFSNVSEYTNLGVYKILLDENGEELSKAVHMDQIAPDSYQRIIIESASDLFSGLSIDQSQWQDNYSFRLVTFGVKQGGEEVLFDEVYEFTPEYNVLEFAVTYSDASTGNVDYLRTSETKVDGEVDIKLVFTVTAEAEDAVQFAKIGLIKHFLAADGSEIDTAVVVENIQLGKEKTVTISDLDNLFSGIEYDRNSNMTEAMTFAFTLFVETKLGETVVMDDIFNTTATYDVKILPVLETGIWIAKNEDTGFTKEIELLWLEEQQQYGFTDFGLDWSWITDQWPGTLFTLKFPAVESDPIYVDLSGVFVWEYGNIVEMLAPSGEMVTKEVIHFGYIYKPGSPVGYYDKATGNLIFRNVNITDSAWDWDKHDNVNITFSKK